MAFVVALVQGSSSLEVSGVTMGQGSSPPEADDVLMVQGYVLLKVTKLMPTTGEFLMVIVITKGNRRIVHLVDESICWELQGSSPPQCEGRSLLWSGGLVLL